MEDLTCVLHYGEKCYLSCICGDFNYDLIKTHHHVPTQDFFAEMLNNGYAPFVNKPTRVMYTSSTLIDNIFIKASKMMQSLSYVIVDGMSDHFPCLVSYCLEQYHSSEPILIRKRKFNDEAISSIQQSLLFNDWSTLYEMSCADAYGALNDAILKAFDQFAPVKVTKICPDEKFQEPWLTVRIKKYNTKCRSLCNRARVSKNEDDIKKYRAYRNIVNRLKLYEKKQHYAETFRKIGRNIKLMWNVVNNLLKKTSNKQDTIELLRNDKLLTDQSEVSNVLNLHFANAGSVVQSSIPTRASLCNDVTSSVKKVSNRMKFKMVSESHVCKLVSVMKPKTSSGVDSLSNLLLKQIINVIKEPLTLVVNKSLLEGSYPDILKLAKVIPLHKGGETCLSDNYRPISLLPVLSKVLEKVIYEQTVNYLNENNILYPRQYGFRSKHSTSDAIKNLVGDVIKAFDDKMMVLSVFIDLRKAFDTVSHLRILKKLECLGICDLELDWFKNYLCDR